MHVYIYDSFLSQRKFHSTLAKIETRLTDLGLNGKVVRLGLIKNTKEIIENEVRRGAKTIIAVGDDQLISEAVSGVAGTSIPFGAIPINTGQNRIAGALGINSTEEACNILSARRIEKLDLGIINNSFFLSGLSITNNGTIIQINQDYSVEPLEDGRVQIINLPLKGMELPENFTFNPQDGNMELVIKIKKGGGFLKTKEAEQGVFTVQLLTIFNKKNHPVLADDSREITTPAEVGILKSGLNVIVGKNRNF